MRIEQRELSSLIQIRKRMMKEEDRKEEVDRLGGGCTTPSTHTVHRLMMDLFFSFPRERANKTAPIHSAAVDEKGASQELQKYSFSFYYFVYESGRVFS